MRQPAHLSIVREGDRPPPLLPKDIDLSESPDALISRKDFLKGRLARTGSFEERVAAWSLYMVAIDEDHAASLPNDDHELAFLAGYQHDIAGWRRVKEPVLQDWVLCSDGRYYHTDLSIRSLVFWIKRIASRRKAEAANCRRYKRTFDEAKFDRLTADAIKYLTALDPESPILTKFRNPEPDIVAEAESAPSSAPSTSSGTPMLKPKAKPMDISSEHSSDDSRSFENSGSEIEHEGRSEDRTEPIEPAETPVPPWPPDCLARFKARYPRDTRWPSAEKALQKLRKAGKIAFDDLMAGVERLIAEDRPAFYVPHAVNWLRDRGWEDASAARPRGPPARAQPPRFRNGILSYLAKEGIIE